MNEYGTTSPGAEMILPELKLNSRINQKWSESGLDSQEHCRDQDHFNQYPYTVEYLYNSRGFRDLEWPEDLVNCVWCIGDSYTVGLGAPFEHTWPQVLQHSVDRPAINISMDGASNQWISRRAHSIISAVNPQHMVIMWSYFWRRELADATLDDEQRRIVDVTTTSNQDLEDFLDCIAGLTADNIVHVAVPGCLDGYCLGNIVKIISSELQATWDGICGQSWPDCPESIAQLNQLPADINNEIKEFNLQDYFVKKISRLELAQTIKLPQEVVVLDLARDGHHFDIKTSQALVASVITQLQE